MHNPALRQLFDHFWRDYSGITPQAPRIHELLTARGETVANDHVAFRTYDLDPIDLESLAPIFVRLGYQPTGEYEFPEKKLRARSFAHTEGWPHVFISELLTRQCSTGLQQIVHGLVEQVPRERRASVDLLTLAPSWRPVPYSDYATLLGESEYAGWLAAYGLRVNHFTVLVNALRTFGSIQELNAFLQQQGFPLNESGGVVKGTPEQLLEQSSTLASRIEWEFAGGERRVVPGCYYEFARRYDDPATGKLYGGFMAKSADRIFESTDTGNL